MSSDYPVEEIGQWKKEKVLGAGGFGYVVLWRNKVSNETIALKECRWGHDPMMTPKHRSRWKLEVDMMSRLNHPNVITAIAVPPELDVPATEMPLLAMEYCSNGDLRKLLNKPENCCGLKEMHVRLIMKHISSAVNYLHSVRIIHRDLKPENIVIQDQNGNTIYKLIDLGYAKELDQGSFCTSFVGTLQYLAPELFMSQK
ncbi:inhibitor of nuclear factor kappa-B kinase subunit alpha [Trichonephila clavata]|uniref:IkappaB kinase n=1 Tax=Trichonephila clavata TaxID=2740835 RepID=A0A8X6J0V7_TRICU|nr:inhibitor of nuclear factor kappa-B kinase subunit alpha [Trichonephila clavata]